VELLLPESVLASLIIGDTILPLVWSTCDLYS